MSSNAAEAEPASPESPGWHWGAGLAATFCITLWGAVPLVTKFAAGDFSGEIVGVLRVVFCLPLVVVLLMAGRKPLPAGAAVWGKITMTALGVFVAFPVLFSLGQSMTTASHGGLIIALAPVLTGLMAMVWDRRRPPVSWVAGAVIGFAGVSALILLRSDAMDGPASPTVAGDLLVLAGVAGAAVGYVSGARLSESLGSRAVTYWANVIAGLVLLPWAVWELGVTDIGAVRPGTWMAIIYLALFAQVVNFLLWYWAMGKAGVARIAAFQFVQPVITLVLAVLLFDEVMTPALLAATALILVGVGLCQLKRH